MEIKRRGWPAGRWMDLVVMGAPLENLKDQIRNRSSWRKMHVVANNQHQLDRA